MKRSYFKITITDSGEFNCVCGNRPDYEGAYPCDRSGKLVDPTPGDWPEDLYRCDRCGIIFKGATGEVVGQLPLDAHRINQDNYCDLCREQNPEGECSVRPKWNEKKP